MLRSYAWYCHKLQSIFENLCFFESCHVARAERGYPHIILVRLLMDRLNCPVVKNCHRISTERLLYQSTIFRGCSPNVIKRWKSSTESARPFVVNNYHNWSVANRQWICRQLQQFFSHYESLKMCTIETIDSWNLSSIYTDLTPIFFGCFSKKTKGKNYT